MANSRPFGTGRVSLASHDTLDMFVRLRNRIYWVRFVEAWNSEVV